MATSQVTLDVIARSDVGVTITDVAKSGTRKEWEDLLRPVRDQWAAGMKARGLAGPEVLAAWDKALAGSR